jgi:transcriptional regulator GlxA family with amidase domain
MSLMCWHRTPYEVFADTGAFNLYTVAEQRRSVPLTGGVDLIPDLSFADLEKRLPTGPDVIVVPQLNDAGEPSAYPIVQWLQQQRRKGDPLLVSVCVLVPKCWHRPACWMAARLPPIG